MPFKIRAILAATDLSSGSELPLRTASALARLTEAGLHVIHVRDDASEDEQSSMTLRKQIRAVLPPSSGVDGAEVRTGRPDAEILKRAEEIRADLIVIGPHRAVEGEPRDLGTTADHLVRTSEVPCLVVHAPLSLPLRRILVPSDLSDASTVAVEVAFVWGAALRLPRGTGEETVLHALHVAPPPTPDPEMQELRARSERQFREQIAEAARRTGCESLLKVDRELMEGDQPSALIGRIAEQRHPDLIVIGTHGRGRLERALIGSVSSAVARDAATPVLLVPPGYWKARRDRERKMDRSSD